MQPAFDRNVTMSKFFKSLLALALAISSFSAAFSQERTIAARFVVIGDPGKIHNGRNAVVEAVHSYIAPSDKLTSVLILGDNIYPKGMPGTEDKSYRESAEILTAVLTPFKDYSSRIYLVPGNHDWQQGGPDGWQRIKNQQQFVNELDQSNVIFVPKDGCPGPEEISINDDLVLIIMDTQWWLHRYSKPGIDNDCECKTEDEVLSKLRDIVFRNAGKKILFAAHHPLRSHGSHGGYYTLREHIFPLTDANPKLYIPFPVVGSLYPFVRGTFGNIEDLKHPLYRDMIRGIEQSLSKAANVTYAGGHDHNLQLIVEGTRNHIVSGSGTNRSPVKKAGNSLYASDENGFVEIIYFSTGEQSVIYHTVDLNGKRTQTFDYNVKTVPEPESSASSSMPASFPDSVTVAIAPEYDAVGKGHRRVWGEHYRKIWATPVKMKVFRVEKEKGGLKVLKKGGGQQTKSLRLEDNNGRQWVLRTIQKDPEKALPANLRATIAKSIIQDQISAANPYAPLTVPILATAAGVPHANPQIVFVPDDPTLGVYRSEFANTVCVFEEREPGTDDETLSTDKVYEKLEKDNDNIVDQRAVLRARMLDLLIGDWDRHEDQWRWQVEKTKKKNIYRPVPRDRDQVYYINTGIVPDIARRKWIMPKFQGFDDHIRDINGFMYNARYFDRAFINELSINDWRAVISELTSSLTDDIIERSVRQFPDTVFAQVGARIIHNLKSRRDALMTEGLTYYQFLAEGVTVAASDKKDYFNVRTNEKGDAEITIQKIKKDENPGDTIYHRFIDHDVTDEVRLFGRGGEDVFVIDGPSKPQFRIRMIGGGSVDSFYVSPDARSRAKLMIYDRSDKKNFYPGRGVTLKTSSREDVNYFDPREFRYNKLAPLATAAFNLDDGILLGAGGVYTKYGFRREPFAARHRIMVGHALATNATFLRYKGDVTNVVGRGALDMYFNIAAPDNTANFFGVGNETVYNDVTSPPIRYYRTRYNFIDGQARLRFPVAKSFNLFAGAAASYFNMDPDDNLGRFIVDYGVQLNDQSLFKHKLFAGGVAGFEVDTRNNPMLPIRGFLWRTSFTAMDRVNGSGGYSQLKTEMNTYISFTRNPKIVIANRLAAGVSFGAPEFFQMFYMGGDGGLLGYRKNRFAGNSMFYDNFELRIKLFDFQSFLFPGTAGLIGFNDIGRVWADGEKSNKWHWGYGGGFYLIPAETIVITGVAGLSEEGVLPYVNLGFRF